MTTCGIEKTSPPSPILLARSTVATRWPSRALTSNSVHGVDPASWSGRTPAFVEGAGVDGVRHAITLARQYEEFDPIPFDADAARTYGRVVAAVVAVGRKPRRRIADLMIASVAITEGLPLFTTNPDDFVGLDRLLTVVPVTRPGVLPTR